MKVAPLAKQTVPVVLGVLIAGYVMSQFRNVGVIAAAHNGYDS